MNTQATPDNSIKNENRRSQAAESATRTLDSHPVLTAIGVISFGLIMGVLVQKALTSDFIGSGTNLVAQCKRNPKYNPEACAPILEARSPARQRTRGGVGIDPESRPFQLSDE
jgi:hypothetical protein